MSGFIEGENRQQATIYPATHSIRLWKHCTDLKLFRICYDLVLAKLSYQMSGNM